jgi:hypothetical protein
LENFTNLKNDANDFDSLPANEAVDDEEYVDEEGEDNEDDM